MPQDNTTMLPFVARRQYTDIKSGWDYSYNWLQKIAEEASREEDSVSMEVVNNVLNIVLPQLVNSNAHYTAQLEEKDKRIAELEAQIEAIRDAYGLRE